MSGCGSVVEEPVSLLFSEVDVVVDNERRPPARAAGLKMNALEDREKARNMITPQLDRTTGGGIAMREREWV
jgi:hypothetical protein